MTTYYVNDHTSTDFITGYIVTDGNTGFISVSDITNYYLFINDGTDFLTLNPKNSSISGNFNNAFEATSTQLLYNFTLPAPNADLLISSFDGLNSIEYLLTPNINTLPGPGLSIGIDGIVSTRSNNTLPTLIGQTGGPSPALAQVNTLGPADLPNVHQGDDDQTTLSITNSASAPAESLDGSVAVGEATDDANGDGFFGVASGNGLVPGDTDNTDISVALTTDTAGKKSGTVTLNFVSDGTQIPGDGTTTALPSQTVTVSGNVYRLAEPTKNISAPSYVHVDDPTDVSVTITNNASNDGYSEDLIASVAGTSGNVVAFGTVQDLSPGQSSSDAITVAVPTDDAVAGVVSGTLSIDLVSDGDPVDGLGRTTLSPQQLDINITVDNYADPALEIESSGTLSSTHIDLEGPPPISQSYILDLGNIPLNSGTISSTVAMKNDIESTPPGDFLIETSILPGAIAGPWSFSTAFYLPTAAPLAPGFQDPSVSPRVVTFDPNTVGTFSAAVEFDTSGVFPDGSGAPSPTITTLTITATVIGPPSLVNDNPLTLLPGSTAAITLSLLKFSDTLSPPLQMIYNVTQQPVNGVLHLNALPATSFTGTGGAISLCDSSIASFTQADIDNGLVAYEETLPGATTDSFSFTVSDSAGASTSGQFEILISAPCYCRGTLILTDGGEVPVEALAIGNRVVTVAGPAKPIKWIGRRAYDPRFVAGNHSILPIKIEAGALEEGVPARDLWVSPEHALYIDGVLVPARLLVNGATITQVESIERLEYFHIELDTHDVILAEGTPAETFVECDNRGMFHNSREFAALYPADAPAPWQFCAPRLEPDAPELAAIRGALLLRTEALGYALTHDPDLRLVVDGTIVRPDPDGACFYRFIIPAGARAVAIASRSAVPAEVDSASQDRRRLGVGVEWIILGGAGLRIEIGPDCPALREGFHHDEGAHRWTDGMARLPEELLRPFAGAVTLEVQLITTQLRYRLDMPATATTIKARKSLNAHRAPARRRARRAG